MSTTDTTAAPTDTERLGALLDRGEIADLVARSLVAIDEARFDDLRDLYAEDASASTPGGEARGIDAIVAHVGRTHTPERRTQHLLGDVVVDLDGDTARARANVIAGFTTSAADDTTAPAPPVEVTFGTVYRYRAVRTPAGWRLSQVEIHPVWVDGATENLLPRAAD